MTYPNLLTTDETAELEDLERLRAWDDGVGRLAYDPPAPGRPIHVVRNYSDDEPTFHQQETAGGLPVWVCADCGKLTVGASPARCVGCGHEETEGDEWLSEVLGIALECRSWDNGYDGPCLIAGSDGCDCEETL